ncbi:chorismate mutase/prephenate dehydratase [Fonsecaea pedrosoi]|nr:chorismate mutase/prephenate dehydratase [Fonsecaea pedrosoi]
MADSNHATTLNVAYLGPEASFSHQAAIEVFRASSSPGHTVSLHPLPSFPVIFSAIQATEASEQTISYDFAVVPFENSTNGSVVPVFDLLARCGHTPMLYPDLEVCAEYYLPVHHCLFVSPSSRSATTSSQSLELSDEHKGDLLRAIRTLYTHPQVWGQCNRYLAKHFPPNVVERIDVGSTSAAAQLVARESQQKSKTPVTDGISASISPKIAGEKHDLLCLAENIEDEPGLNTTRFLVVRNRNRQTQSEDLHASLFLPHNHVDDSRYKSLISFTIPHSKPGSLADALAVFKHYGFNLTSIDTRPSRTRTWQYVFFVECEEANPDQHNRAVADVGLARDDARGGQEDKNGNSNLMKMLSELGKFTETLRYLGRFVDQSPRNQQEDESKA